MDRKPHLEGESPKEKPEVRFEKVEYAPPPQEKLENVDEIPEAPRRQLPKAEKQEGGLLRPKSVAELVELIGNLGKSANLDTSTAKRIQDAILEAKKNKN